MSDDLSILRRRGRPPTGEAKSAAERQRERRVRLAGQGIEELTVELSVESIAGLRQFVRFKDLTISQVIDRLVRKQLLRPR